jgi:hypothetical protein
MTILLKAAALIIGATLATASLGPVQVHAQTAKNLKCKGCVGKKDLGKKAVRGKHIKPGQITSAHIGKGAVAPAALSDAAKPSGADASETVVDTDLSPAATDIVLQSVTLTAPGPGMVIATGGLYIDYQGVAGRFSCTVDTAVAAGGHYVIGESVGDGQVPVAITRVFAVDAAGNVTVHLLCREITGDVRANNPKLVAWFVPGAY